MIVGEGYILHTVLSTAHLCLITCHYVYSDVYGTVHLNAVVAALRITGKLYVLLSSTRKMEYAFRMCKVYFELCITCWRLHQ